VGRNAVALDHMVGDLEDFLDGQVGTKQRSAGALGEVLTAERTAQAANISWFANLLR
jgi:hypothetical protein